MKSFLTSMVCRVCFCLALALSVPASAEPVVPDAELPYQAQKSNPVTYDIDFSVVVTPPYKTKTLKVWLPLPESDAAQEVTEKSLSVFPTDLTPRIEREPVFGNRFAYFEFHDPKGAQIIRYRFQAKIWELRWNIDATKVQAVEDWPADFERYRRPEGQSVVIDGRFHELLDEIVPRRTGKLGDLEAVIGWVHKNFQYDHIDASLQASSVHALEKQRGHCSDYHGFCASLGRALGYPTRVTYGINTFAKNSPSHCKLEAFIPPYGWVSFDVSETQKLIQSVQTNAQLSSAEKERFIESATTRLMAGFRDNTWLLQTRGTDYDLAPPAKKKVPVVRTIYAEADGVELQDADPANPKQRAFSWMTAHKYVPDREVPYPFEDLSTLERP